MKQLTPEKVYPTEVESVPGLESFQCDVNGPRAILKAFVELAEGKAHEIILADCSFEGNQWQIDELIPISIGEVEGTLCFRYHGDKVGSHSVIATWYDDCMDPAVAALHVALHIRGSVFRLNPEGDAAA